MKELQRVKIKYEVMVVVDSEEDAGDVVCRELKKILKNEDPDCEFFGVVEDLDESDVEWYNSIPYGDSKGKPCQYFVAESAKGREIVEEIKGMLSEEDWKVLVDQILNTNP